MNHALPPRENTGLLVSVRSADEVRIAVESKCVSIIDLKEPVNGSLGCVSIDSARAIVGLVPKGAMVSIALGEVADWPVWTEANPTARSELLAQFGYAKVGLSGMASDSNWIQRWMECLAELPENVQRVAVAYADSERADSPPIQSVLESAVEVGCSVLLIDTFCKEHGGLLDLFSIEELAEIVRAAKAKGLKVVLAGSLDVAGIRTLGALEVDFLAVRGAVCGDGRTSTIKAQKILELGELLQHLNSEIPARRASE